MLTSEKRDEIYGGETPRTSIEHIQQTIERLNKHLPENVKWLNFLDYAAWTWGIWGEFLKKWANVDFAEIANAMIHELRQEFTYNNEIWDMLDERQNRWQAKVFPAKSPIELPVENEHYNYIIAWAIFHHVSPEYRKEFLDKFWELLKKDWKIFIAWWDETDIVLREDWYKGHVTWEPSYTINSLPQYMNNEIFEIEETWTFDQKIPYFDIPRTFRYYIVKHKNFLKP